MAACCAYRWWTTSRKGADRFQGFRAGEEEKGANINFMSIWGEEVVLCGPDGRLLRAQLNPFGALEAVPFEEQLTSVHNFIEHRSGTAEI